MRRFVEEADRGQWTLLPECLDDFIDESNPVRVIDVFVDALHLAEMSFEGCSRRQRVGAGAGIALLPSYLCRDAIHAGVACAHSS
jgi:transposase